MKCFSSLGRKTKKPRSSKHAKLVHGASADEEPEVSQSQYTPFDGARREGREKGVVRVRIVLTKAEVARLLSGDEGEEEEEEDIFEIVKAELERRGRRKSVKDNGREETGSWGEHKWTPELDAIPEEDADDIDCNRQ